MVQIGLTGDGEPELLAYAQHDSGEPRKVDDVEWVERDGERHPVVYVAPLFTRLLLRGRHPSLPDRDRPPLRRWARIVAAGRAIRRLGELARALGQRRAGDRSPDRQRAAEPVAPGREVDQPGRLPAKAGAAQVPRRPRPAAPPPRRAVLPQAARAQCAARAEPLHRRLSTAKHQAAALPAPVPDRARWRAGDREPSRASGGRIRHRDSSPAAGAGVLRGLRQHLQPRAPAQRSEAGVNQ